MLCLTVCSSVCTVFVCSSVCAVSDCLFLSVLCACLPATKCVRCVCLSVPLLQTTCAPGTLQCCRDVVTLYYTSTDSILCITCHSVLHLYRQYTVHHLSLCITPLQTAYCASLVTDHYTSTDSILCITGH